MHSTLKRTKIALAIILCAQCAFNGAEAWLVPQTCRKLSWLSMTSGEEGDPLVPQEKSEAKRQQEMMLEEMSLKGAEKIAAMGIPERAKRAMLAEAVEDRIFELTEVLETLVEEDGSVAEQNRERVVEIARDVKQFQQQYSDLVNGNRSAILDALSSDGSS